MRFSIAVTFVVMSTIYHNNTHKVLVTMIVFDCKVSD